MFCLTLLIRLAKKAKAFLKRIIKGDRKATISPVRRIERVATKRRVVAMTFDDGPCALPANPDRWDGRALTDIILDTLAKYGAKGTFDVVGDTSGNYPDRPGKEGGPQWGGIRFDHYPDFGQDEKGGAHAQPELVGRILAEGHEITNHGYQHRLFGPQPLVYGKRQSFSGMGEVVEDLSALHKLMANEHGCRMTLSRPPHYVDRIDRDFTSYDAYHVMDYQYMAASFDGAGWLPSAAGYDEEVELMVRPLRTALERDPDSLCGQIIFQKDGFNMARRSPVADGLDAQLALLKEYGYEVVTVSELLAVSQAADVDGEEELAGAIADMIRLRHPVLYSDNTFRKDAPLTRGEFAMMLADRETTLARIVELKKGKQKKLFPDVPLRHPYSTAIRRAVEGGFLMLDGGRFRPDAPLDNTALDRALHRLCGVASPFEGTPAREQVVLLLAKLLVRMEEKKA